MAKMQKLVLLIVFIGVFCPVVKVIGQLTFYLPSEKVSEGPCSKPPPSVASNLKIKWLSQPRHYYITHGNKAMIRRYAEVFLNRPAKSVDELEALCPQISMNGKNVTIFANGNKTIEKSCTSKQSGVFNCFAMKGTPGVNITAIDTTVETVVYSDNSQVILIERCINDQVRDYQLLSTSKDVPKSIITAAKEKISQRGFTTLYFAKLTCEGNYAI